MRHDDEIFSNLSSSEPDDGPNAERQNADETKGLTGRNKSFRVGKWIPPVKHPVVPWSGQEPLSKLKGVPRQKRQSALANGNQLTFRGSFKRKNNDHLVGEIGIIGQSLRIAEFWAYLKATFL